jgi:hypothetical protein
MNTKKCQYCAEVIALEAIKCKHCGELLTEEAKQEKKQHEVSVKKESRSGALTWLIVLGVIALLAALTGI